MTDRATTSVFEDALCEVAAGTHRFGALGAGTGPGVGEICPGRWADAAGDLDLLDPLPDDAVDDAHQL